MRVRRVSFVSLRARAAKERRGVGEGIQIVWRAVRKARRRRRRGEAMVGAREVRVGAASFESGGGGGGVKKEGRKTERRAPRRRRRRM